MAVQDSYQSVKGGIYTRAQSLSDRVVSPDTRKQVFDNVCFNPIHSIGTTETDEISIVIHIYPADSFVHTSRDLCELRHWNPAALLHICGRLFSLLDWSCSSSSCPYIVHCCLASNCCLDLGCRQFLGRKMALQYHSSERQRSDGGGYAEWEDIGCKEDWGGIWRYRCEC